MVRFLVTYDTPSDPEAFERHYDEVHAPLTRRLPHVVGFTVHRRPKTVRGVGYFQVTEVTWRSWEAVQTAFASEAGQAAAADMANLDAPTRSCLYEVPDDRRPDACNITA